MAATTTGLLAASLATSALGTMSSSYAQAKAAKTEGRYQQQQFETNARLADIQAKDAIKRGDKESANHMKKVRAMIGSQRAKMAAQGIDANSGSALDIQMDTAIYGSMDAQTIKNNAWREAWGYRVQANDYSGQGAMANLAAKNKARNTILTGGMTVASDITSGIYSYKTSSRT